MSSESAVVVRTRARPTAVLVLGILGLLTFALIPIQVNTIYGGLPAHPLFLHVPVILIPVVGIAALAVAARPALLERHGIWITAVTVAALAASGGQAALVARHEHAADIRRLLMILFTALVIVVLALWRADGDAGVSGIAFVDGLLVRVRALMPALIPARLALAALALACLYFVFHTGDLGARAVWQGRFGGTPLHALGFSGHGGLGGGLFGPGIHPPGAPRG